MKKYFVLIAALLFVLISASKADLPDTVWCKYTYPTQINAVKFTPDGRYLASAGTDGVVRLWETQTGNLVREYLGAGSAIWGMDLYNDSLVAAVTDLSKITIWDFNTGKIIQVIDYYPNQNHSLENNSVAFSKSGKYLAAHIAKYGGGGMFGYQPALFIWNTKDWSVLGKVENIQAPKDVNFSPDEKLLAVSSILNIDTTASIGLFNVPNLMFIGMVKNSKGIEINKSTFSNDGNYLGGAYYNDGNKIWNTTDWSLYRSFKTGDARSVVFSEDNQYYAVGAGGIHWYLLIYNVLDNMESNRYILNYLSKKYLGTNEGDAALSISISKNSDYIGVGGSAGIYLLNAKWDTTPVLENPIQVTNTIIFPNPTNGTANIQFDLLRPEFIDIKIYNTASNLVTKIFEGQVQQGMQNFQWNTSLVATGIYFCRIIAAGTTSTIKIIVNK
ncbi:MAG: T9SS type A sorting domain-containing protein [Candidatus Kapabacteria bacterium]|nr:T9SS type A sorting domain-containing protein [Candidatus Kapabacteria bacterium]